MKALIFSSLFFLSFFDAFTDTCGRYAGSKDDYITELKLYDDSVFRYTASREFPFEVSDGTWIMKGDTVILNSIPCKDPAALNHPPLRTYVMFHESKYLHRKNSLTPLDKKNKLVKSEILQKASEE
jgi:hypothetical protein